MSAAVGGPSPYRKLLEKAFAEAIPLSAQLELTFRCNHRCAFCYNAPSERPEMTTEDLFETLRKISELGVLYATLTGGEPLCRKDFWEIAAEVRRLGMALRVYSNGYLLADPAIARRLADLHPLKVEISLHRSRPEIHDALTRVPGSLDRTVSGIRNLRGSGVRVQLKCPITRLNQADLREIKRLASDLDSFLTFDPVVTPRDDGSLDPLSFRPDDAFLERYWGEWYLELHDGKAPPLAEPCAPDRAEAVCGSGRAGLTVDPYGEVFPCVAFRRSAGNIVEIESLAKVWRESPVLEEVRALAVEARRRLDGHENGRHFAFCMGIAEKQTGDPLGLYPQAEVNARAARRAHERLRRGKETGRKTP